MYVCMYLIPSPNVEDAEAYSLLQYLLDSARRHSSRKYMITSPKTLVTYYAIFRMLLHVRAALV